MPSASASFVFLAMAFAAGVAIAVQQVVNAGFRNAVGSAWWAGLASYVGGTLFMIAALLVVRERVPSLAQLKQVPAAAWTGGILGGIYVALSLYLLPRLGVALVLALVVVGQMVTSLVIDQLGLFGVEQHAVSPLRLAGRRRADQGRLAGSLSAGHKAVDMHPVVVRISNYSVTGPGRSR